MATVPKLQIGTVAPQAAPDFRQSSPIDPRAAGIAGRQAEQFGAAISQAGEGIAQRERVAFDQANALRVDDALNQATEQALRLQHDKTEGYTSLKGYDAVSRQSGLPLADEFAGKLDTAISGIASGLANDRQRQMFAARANDIRARFHGEAMRYEGAQYQEYNQSVREASVTNAANALVLNFSDPTNVQTQVTRIRGAIEGGMDPATGVFVPGSAQMQGKSAAWAKEKADEAVSGAHLGAIKAAMEAGNLNGAMSYRKKYADQLTASDMLKIDGTLQHNYDTMVGARLGTEIVQGTRAAVQPTDFDRFANIVAPGDMGKLTQVIAGVESRNRDTDASGNVITSPKGAQGRMQVMPATQKDPGFGVRPAADDSLEEKARVGRDYLAAMVKRYDGNLAKAAAAYNWGPGAVDSAVKAAQQNAGKGEAVPDSAWLASAPKETRDYVAKVLTAMQSPTGGVPQRPTLESLHQQVRARLGPTASPQAMKSALDTVSQQFEDQTKAIAQRKDEVVSQAMQALAQNGGRYSDLPATVRGTLQQVAPEKIDDVMSFGKKISAGDDTTDPALYLKLSNDPQGLKGMSEAQFYQLRGRLSQSDFQHFANKRAELVKGTESTAPGNLNDSAINRTLNSRLAGLGIDPTPKDATADAERVGAIRRFVDASLIDAQRAAGKKFDDAQTQAHIDGLFAKSVQFRKTFLGIDMGSGGQSLMAMKIGDIPGDQKDRIKAAFKKQGVDSPTDGQILGAYFAAHAQQSTGKN